jgi:hypothetical protein
MKRLVLLNGKASQMCLLLATAPSFILQFFNADDEILRLLMYNSLYNNSEYTEWYCIRPDTLLLLLFCVPYAIKQFLVLACFLVMLKADFRSAVNNINLFVIQL